LRLRFLISRRAFARNSFLLEFVSHKVAKQIPKPLRNIKLGPDPNIKLVHVQVTKLVIAGTADGSFAWPRSANDFAPLVPCELEHPRSFNP
jgi:hypothetical protein